MSAHGAELESSVAVVVSAPAVPELAPRGFAFGPFSSVHALFQGFTPAAGTSGPVARGIVISALLIVVLLGLITAGCGPPV